MKMQRLSRNFSWPARITGYGLFLLLGIVIPPFFPIVAWAVYQSEINRRKTKHMMKLNDWAVYNPDKARSLGIEPNFRAAFNVGGLAGIYLDITAYNADPLFEQYVRNGGKITRGAVEDLAAEQIELLLHKIKVLDRWAYLGCFGTIIITLLAMIIFISTR